MRLETLELDLVRPMALAKRVPAGIQDDSVEPGVEAGAVPQAGDLHPRGDEGLLCRVMGVCFVAQDGAGRAKDAVDVCLDEQLERIPVAARRQFDQRVARGG